MTIAFDQPDNHYTNNLPLKVAMTPQYVMTDEYLGTQHIVEGTDPKPLPEWYDDPVVIEDEWDDYDPLEDDMFDDDWIDDFEADNALWAAGFIQSEPRGRLSRSHENKRKTLLTNLTFVIP